MGSWPDGSYAISAQVQTCEGQSDEDCRGFAGSVNQATMNCQANTCTAVIAGLLSVPLEFDGRTYRGTLDGIDTGWECSGQPAPAYYGVSIQPIRATWAADHWQSTKVRGSFSVDLRPSGCSVLMEFGFEGSRQ